MHEPRVDKDLTADGKIRCACTDGFCNHTGRCEDPVGGGSEVYCRGCYLMARAEDAAQRSTVVRR